MRILRYMRRRDRTSVCGAHHAARHGCNKRLMIQRKKDVRFDKLRFDHGSADGQYRLSGKDHASLGDRPDVTRKAEGFEVVEKFLVEHLLRAQVFYIVLFKAQILKIATYPLESADYRISAGIRVLSEEHVEIRDPVAHIRMKIASSHGKLIEIREKCKMLFVEHTSVSFLF